MSNDGKLPGNPGNDVILSEALEGADCARAKPAATAARLQSTRRIGGEVSSEVPIACRRTVFMLSNRALLLALLGLALVTGVVQPGKFPWLVRSSLFSKVLFWETRAITSTVWVLLRACLKWLSLCLGCVWALLQRKGMTSMKTAL
jgi:hypothetical protein